MEDYTDVIEVLYDIKDKITDHQYMILNDSFLQLIRIAESYNRLIPSENYFNEYSTDSDIDIESDVEEEVPNNEPTITVQPIIPPRIQEVNTRENQNICQCTENDVCVENIKKFCSCSNLERFLEINPIARRLIDENVPITFTRIPVLHQEVNRSFCVKNIKLCLDFITNLHPKSHRIIIASSIYDFLMKNLQFVRLNKTFRASVLKKITEFSQEEEFQEFLRENDFSFEIWKNAFTFDN